MVAPLMNKDINVDFRNSTAKGQILTHKFNISIGTPFDRKQGSFKMMRMGE